MNHNICEGCHLKITDEFIALELHRRTLKWSDPDYVSVPPEDSQGLFDFHIDCAKSVLQTYPIRFIITGFDPADDKHCQLSSMKIVSVSNRGCRHLYRLSTGNFHCNLLSKKLEAVADEEAVLRDQLCINLEQQTEAADAALHDNNDENL